MGKSNKGGPRGERGYIGKGKNGGDSKEKLKGELGWGDERVGESLRVLCKKKR